MAESIACANAIAEYRADLSLAIRRISPILQDVAKIRLYFTNIVMDVVGLVGGVIGGIVAGAWAVLNFLIEEFIGWDQIFEGVADAVTDAIDSTYIWNPFGADIMTETEVIRIVL
jgi:hypothetical protein